MCPIINESAERDERGTILKREREGETVGKREKEREREREWVGYIQ